MTEPHGVSGQRAAYCSCGAYYFTPGHFRHRHFAQDGHQRVSWTEYRRLWPNKAADLVRRVPS